QDAGARVSGSDRRRTGCRRLQIPYSSRLYLLCNCVFGGGGILQRVSQAPTQARPLTIDRSLYYRRRVDNKTPMAFARELRKTKRRGGKDQSRAGAQGGRAGSA